MYLKKTLRSKFLKTEHLNVLLLKLPVISIEFRKVKMRDSLRTMSLSRPRNVVERDRLSPGHTVTEKTGRHRDEKPHFEM